jgi:hypothetical protein
MPNEAVNDKRLSFRARGVLAYLLGRPPGWRFSAERICAEGTEGRDAVASALRELTEHGYYRWTKVRSSDGTFVTVTEVAATPDLMPPLPTGDGFSGLGSPGAGEPGSGEPSPMSVPRGTTESQTSPRPSDGDPSATAKPKSAAATGTRLAADWKPDVAALAWAADQGISDDEVVRWTAAFTDHWTAVPGSRGRKVDWTATWRNWLRREQDRQGGRDRKIANRHVDVVDKAEAEERRAAWGES